jgi:4a-hydroxytetrahydrobiopterin dehydratase
MPSLASQSCVPCRGDTPAIQGSQLGALQAQVPEWAVIDEHRLSRNFRFPDFKQALDFVNRVGAVAEQQGHHPDIVLAWGKVEITLWTHAIHGLSESDFIMAAKIDQL